MTTQINTLQQAVESLSANMPYLRPPTEGGTPVPPSPSMMQNTPRLTPLPVYSMSSGPLTNTVPTDQALDSSLRNQEPSLAYTPLSPTLHLTKDPIWGVSKEEAIRLTNVWRDTIHNTLPIVNIERTMQHIDMLYSFLGGAKRAGLTATDLPGADAISDTDTLRLKLILATSLAIEGSSDGDMGCKLFTSVVSISESMLFKPVDLDGIELLAMTVGTVPHSFFYAANNIIRQFVLSTKMTNTSHGV
jgi:hypothetical protein